MRSDVVHNTVVLRTVASLLEDGLVLLDKDSRITIFNPSASSIFGISAVDAIGKTFDQLFPALAGKLRNTNLLEEIPDAVLDAKTGEKVDLRIATMDAQQDDGFSPFRVLLARKPYHLPMADPDTERKMEEALDLYSMTLWNFPLVVFATDLAGNNIRGSREFYSMIGLTPDQVVNRNIDDILPREYMGWYYQEDAKSEIQITLGTTTGVQDVVAHKSVIRTADDQKALGFITCLTRQPARSTGVAITSSFIKALDALATPIMLVSFSEARILIVNKAFCAKYGYDRAAVLNKGADFILRGDGARSRRRFAVTLAAGADPTGYFNIRNGAGAIESVRVKAIAIKPEGTPGRPPKYCFLSEF